MWTQTCILVCVCSAALSTAYAADNADADVDAISTAEASAVVIDGTPLFKVAGSHSFPSEKRAHDVGLRIEEAANTPSITPQDIRVLPQEGRIDIVAGSKHLLAVVDSDARLEGLSRSDAAQVRSLIIQQTITRYRADRTPEALTSASVTALLAALAALLMIAVTVRALRAVHRSLEARYRNRVRSLTISSFEVVRADTLWSGVRTIISTLRIILICAIGYLGLAFAMSQFPWTRGVSVRLFDLVTAPIVDIGRELVAYLPKLIFLAVLTLIVRYLLKLASVLSGAVASGAVPLKGFEAEWAQPTYQIVRVLILLLALVIAYPYLPGSGSAAFQGLSIFAGLMLSLGASSAMASVIAGYTVTYRGAFHVGDRIAVGDLVGEVTEVRLMVTHLRTPKNEDIVIPNSLVLSSHIVNYSKLSATQGLVLHTIVRIGYSTPWRQVQALLKLAAERTPDTLKDPPPFVLEKSLDEFSIAYELNVYVEGAKKVLERYAALHRNILDVFNEYGVQIMVPAYEGDPEQPKVVPPERRFVPPALEHDTDERDGAAVVPVQAPVEFGAIRDVEAEREIVVRNTHSDMIR
ncbi:MAG: mechanosensitive ion channel family protein [Povalibacter sp.]